MSPFLRNKGNALMPQYSGGPYRFRTWLRGYLPWMLIDWGVAAKGSDCEQAGGSHEWYNIDGKESGCYHCQVIREGQLWHLGGSQ